MSLREDVEILILESQFLLLASKYILWIYLFVYFYFEIIVNVYAEVIGRISTYLNPVSPVVTSCKTVVWFHDQDTDMENIKIQMFHMSVSLGMVPHSQWSLVLPFYGLHLLTHTPQSFLLVSLLISAPFPNYLKNNI